MPTYEYACRDCGEHLEVVQSFRDAPLTQCPACGGNLRKVFSAAGVIFKGSGWHIKDYAGAGRGAGDKDRDAGDGKGAAAKTDSADRSGGSDRGDRSRTGGGEAAASADGKRQGPSSRGDKRPSSSSGSADGRSRTARTSESSAKKTA